MQIGLGLNLNSALPAGALGRSNSNPVPTVVPAAPVITTQNGIARVFLMIADDPSSVGVRKYAIYSSTTEGGTYTFMKWAYAKVDAVSLANGSTAYYKVSAWNVIGEGPQSAAVSGSAATTNSNLLRMIGTTLFANTAFYEPISGDFKAGSTLSITASDGTTINTKTQGGAIIAYGTFTTAGQKTLTITENFSGGGSNVSTQTISVVALPTVGNVAATAQRIKDRMNAVPSYNTAPSLTVTDMGASIPGGYTGSKIYFHGKSIHAAARYTAIGGFQPTSNNVAGFDPVEQIDVTQQFSQSNNANNGVLRQRLFKQTWVFGVNADGGTTVGHFKVRYSDDEMANWYELAEPVFIKYQTGAHYFKIDPGIAAPAGGRIWEIEFSSFTTLRNTSSINGFGYETGETPQTVADSSPIAMIYVDSFANGAGALDQIKNMGRTAARQLGLLNFWNLAIGSHRYTQPAASTYPLGLDRIGDNMFGIGDLDMPPYVDVLWLNYTINDNGQADYAQAQAIFTNLLLRARRKKPDMLIVFTIGFWAPQDRIGTTLYNTIKAAFNSVADAGMYLNDGVADGWAVPSGVTGSSPYFFPVNNSSVTASVTGSVLTVSSGSDVYPGQYLFNGATDTRSRVFKQLTGTPNGAGTYQLDASPLGGDIASTTLTLQSENYPVTYPTHPMPDGHVWGGGKMKDGAVALVNQLAP